VKLGKAAGGGMTADDGDDGAGHCRCGRPETA
jgi:hypothetical protein